MSCPSNPKAVCCPRRCLWIFSLLVVVASTLCASLWAFAYQSSPSGDSCWVVQSWSPGSFKADERKYYKGLEGTDVRLAWEEDSHFEILHTLYVAAVATSAIGLLWSVNIWQQIIARRDSSQSYIGVLTFYFVVGFSVNLITQLCFVRNRCNDHNAHFALSEDAIPATARYLPMEGWFDISTSSAKVTKALYLTMTLVGGFLTNTMLECALLRKVHTFGSASRLSGCLKCAKLFNLVLLIVNAIALPVAFWIFMHMMDEGVDAVGGHKTGETLTLLFNIGAAVFVTFHVFISLVLMVAFITPSKLPTSTCKAPVCTCIIILSTLCCYGNMVLMLGNAYLLLPADSIINTVCMMILCFVGNPEEDSNVDMDELNACEEGKCSNDHPMKQGAPSDAIVQTATSIVGVRRMSTHSIHSVMSAVEKAWTTIGSLGSQHNYKAFKGENDHQYDAPDIAECMACTPRDECKVCTPRDDTAHTPVLLAPGTPLISNPPTPMSVTSDFHRHVTPRGEDVLPPLSPVSFQGDCVLANPSTPVSVAGPRTPGAASDHITTHQLALPEISDGLFRELKTMQCKSTLERKQVANEARRPRARSPHVPDEFDN